MSCAISPYPYSSLLPDSIRLLRLLPSGDEDAPVQCQLFSYCRQEVSKGNHLYEALSYVWGDENKTLPIFIGKHRFDVTENLHAALSRLRDHSLERIIWVDAICINQGNEKEKEKQIQLMARIYGQAYSVVVWLGKEADDSDVALEAIISAGNDRDLKFTDNATVQQAVIKLLERKWFRRIWVMAHNPFTTLGNSTKEWFRCSRKLLPPGTFGLFVVALKSMDMPFVWV
jgi:hypothetical protein